MLKKQIIKISVVFDTEEVKESVPVALNGKLFNIDGLIDWECRIEKEEDVKADFDGNLENDEEDENDEEI